ncbi:MAG: ABC transporter ATP-binding protein [Syntrophales bacterium]
MLTIDNIYFTHHRGSNSSNDRGDILKGVSFEAPDGQMTTILGPNGSGKTTLFKCISGLWRPRQGKIRFGDRDLAGLSHSERAKLIAVVPQEHDPPFPYTVFDIVLMGRASHIPLFSTPSARDAAATEAALDRIGVAALRGRPYTKISGGERQLVMIARAIAQEAPLLLLDEPTSHLDFRNQILVLEKVRGIVRQRGLTVLMTLHDPNMAMQFSDHVVMIENGSVLAQGPPAEVLTAGNLKRVYNLDISVIRHNGTHIIHPEVKP